MISPFFVLLQLLSSNTILLATCYQLIQYYLLLATIYLLLALPFLGLLHLCYLPYLDYLDDYYLCYLSYLSSNTLLLSIGIGLDTTPFFAFKGKGSTHIVQLFTYSLVIPFFLLLYLSLGVGTWMLLHSSGYLWIVRQEDRYFHDTSLKWLLLLKRKQSQEGY